MYEILALDDFLRSKPLYYDEIDHERIHVAYAILKHHIKHPVAIHIIGTNGKGSTGRMIAYLAYMGQFGFLSSRGGILKRVQDDGDRTVQYDGDGNVPDGSDGDVQDDGDGNVQDGVSIYDDASPSHSGLDPESYGELEGILKRVQDDDSVDVQGDGDGNVPDGSDGTVQDDGDGTVQDDDSVDVRDDSDGNIQDDDGRDVLDGRLYYRLLIDDSLVRRFSVGHYSSPHLLRFNERIWMDGSDVSDVTLEDAHRRLYGILGAEIAIGLSYFEYTTLLAFVVFEDCDLIVIEAGLGGEFDATNVIENKIMTVVTPIGIDHQAFLGESIEEIATTKLRSIAPASEVLMAPQPYQQVKPIAQGIAAHKDARLYTIEQKSDNAWQIRSFSSNIDNFDFLEGSYDKNMDHIVPAWPDYLRQNSIVAMAALDIAGIYYDIEDIKEIQLFGRFYPLTENIRIDVGHNPLAAKAIVEAMDDDTVLIYNSLDDKDYAEVLRILRPKIKRVEIIRIDSQRAVSLQAIEHALDKVGIEYTYFDHTIDPDEYYLVFGSFYVVEAFVRGVDLDVG